MYLTRLFFLSIGKRNSSVIHGGTVVDRETKSLFLRPFAMLLATSSKADKSAELSDRPTGTAIF